MATLKNHLNARGGLRRTLLIVLVACNTANISGGISSGSAAVSAPGGVTILSERLGSSVARPTYGWPLKPFNRPHPVRAYLNDPRIVEVGADRVRPIERLQRPAIRWSCDRRTQPLREDRDTARSADCCRSRADTPADDRRVAGDEDNEKRAAKPAAGVEVILQGSHAATVRRPSNGALSRD